ncbi:AlpA family transcriptional regulator [Prolixibacter sp. SD074]|jgi:excisionase family DNA binding protein|uniref:helix-turn-helix transcriptional regulator n=1 Tax=Prolixibacter sp. SD074 TaxID=2652391 RepID=UPI00127D7CF9|nr:helix-turn-helix domain-containing protein [Prolixibacter sp. SD074]GET28782.1 hypothetical protein SD074_09840 [Prolixibacter sp. SD074]
MEKTILISLPVHELQALIVDSVNSCLKHHPPKIEPSEAPDQILTVDEVSELLHLTKATIYSKHSKGELPGVCKKGKRLYFQRDIILSWIKEGLQKSNSEVEAEADNYLKNGRA